MKNLFFALLMLVVSSYSASAAPAPAPAGAPRENEKGEIIETYAVPTMSNISRLYWALNVYSTDNDQLIDDFLKITECDLFNRYYFNEFEWRKIRQATRIYLDKYKSSFPRRYEYVQPIFFDRYNFDLKGFPIVAGFGFNSSTRLEMSATLEHGEKCGNLSITNLEGYPTSAVLNIKQPFKLTFVRANEEMAKEYLKMLEERGIVAKQGRPAYVRFRVRYDQFIGHQSGQQERFGNFSGVVESIEVFADRALTLKLYEQPMY